MTFDAGWGETRTVEIEAISDTGFHRGTAMFFGFRGQRHGQWRAENVIDGERFADASSRETVEEIHQLRDCVIRVREGDAVGYGIFESMVIGEHPLARHRVGLVETMGGGAAGMDGNSCVVTILSTQR
jgi:hypothetical protein